MNVLLVQYCVHYSLRRYPLSILMYRSEMGARMSPRCTVGGSYYEEEDEDSYECSDPGFSHIGIRCPFTLTITLIAG